MSGNTVTFKWNKEFWGECMHSPQLAAALQEAADTKAGEAEAKIGEPSRATNLKNPNFVTKVATRNGTNSPYYVGLVIAANPRSIYKAQHGQAF
jgi:hypothetical protein